MTKILVALVAALALVSGTTATANADVPWAKFHLKPSKVAKKMHCVKQRHATKPNKFQYGSVTCNVGKTQFDIFTFKNGQQEESWVAMIRSGAPVSQGTHHMAVARGIVVVAKHWRAKGASKAARILDCQVITF